MSGLHKLDIIDNTTAVCTTSEKELFFEVYNKHKTRQGPHWSRMLGEYNCSATDSWDQGQHDIKWKTVPLLKQFARDCECANSAARSNCRLALLQDQSDAAATELHGPPVAVLHQQSHGPAPPHSAAALDQRGIAKRLPGTLDTKREGISAVRASATATMGQRTPITASKSTWQGSSWLWSEVSKVQ